MHFVARSTRKSHLDTKCVCSESLAAGLCSSQLSASLARLICQWWNVTSQPLLARMLITWVLQLSHPQWSNLNLSFSQIAVIPVWVHVLLLRTRTITEVTGQSESWRTRSSERRCYREWCVIIDEHKQKVWSVCVFHKIYWALPQDSPTQAEDSFITT